MRNIIQDILVNISLFSAAWIIGRKLPRRSWFWLRTAVSFAGFCVLRQLYFNGFVPLFTRQNQLFANILGYATLLGLTAVAVAVCFDSDFWAALFCGGTSYCVQHICQRTYRVFAKFVLKDAPEHLHILCFLGVIVCYMLLLYLFVRKLPVDRILVNNKGVLVATLIIIASTSVLDLTFFRAVWEGGDLLWMCIYVSSIMMSLLILALQFNMAASRKKDIELDTIKDILEQERSQYYFEKTMIDMVNIKCHDLKHQIAALDQSAQRKLEEDLSAVVEAYDSNFKTGNVALDVVLTRKNFDCKGRGISLTCVAKGECLDFMSELDIYSLFGNILDNAIEATDKLEDPERRVINLTVFQEGYFVRIHEENYFGGALTFSGGLPETTKKDTAYHGIGLKSIKMLAQKYDGSLKIDTVDGRFVLDIMFSV